MHTRSPAGAPAFLLAVVLALSGCGTVGPDYVRPSAAVPAGFKEMEGWQAAQPLDEVSRGPWWEIYGIDELDALERQVDVSNQSVAQADAQFRAAQAAVTITRASEFPVVGASASASRSSASKPAAAGSNGAGRTVALQASWEPDLWGGVRRAVESSVAGAQASAADLEGMRLSMQGELAQDYFQLRALDAMQQVLDRAVADYGRSLELTRIRYTAGVSARSDVVQAEGQWHAAQARASDNGIQRAQFEHAIAVLVGKPPAEFSIPAQPLAAALPRVPVGVPSELLQRRPDIAGAERRVAAANAQIGVAQAAFYPSLNLTASLGTSFASAFHAGPLLWSLGAALAQTLIDGGARRGHEAQAIADHQAASAAYRQTVLAAFQDVEDQLVAARLLAQEAQAQDQAAASSREAVALTLRQYQAGTVGYLNVLAAQETALSDEQSAVDIQRRRFVASVALVRALGGGWTADRLPDSQAVTPRT